MIKYAIFPDFVRSQTDGDKHFITAKQLMFLYGVHPNECFIVENNKHFRQYDYDLDYVRDNNLIILRPSHSGNYKLPKGNT